MADFAAHLNQRQSLARPSFFELVAQEGMETTLRRAFEFFLQHITISRHMHTNYQWLLARCDEIYALFNCLLQYHYISQHGASLSENFYGMKRICSTQNKLSLAADRRMSESQRRMSLFALVVVPYIKLKLDRLYEYMNEEQQLGSTSSEILVICT
jgi:peroxin-12